MITNNLMQGGTQQDYSAGSDALRVIELEKTIAALTLQLDAAREALELSKRRLEYLNEREYRNGTVETIAKIDAALSSR